MPVQVITMENFDEMTRDRGGPALLDFGAEYCIPCGKLLRIMEEISNERPDVMVGTVDIDEHPELAVRLGVTGIPTVVAMHGGVASGSLTGNPSKEAILALLGGAG
jgi:thioredoxin 1